MDKNKIICAVLKESYTNTVRLHLKDEDDDSDEVTKGLQKIDDFMMKEFKKIEVQGTDESFDHAFGTQHEWGSEAEIPNNILRVLLTVDETKDIEKFAKEYLHWIEGDDTKKITIKTDDDGDEYSRRRPYWVPSQISVEFKINVDIRRKINNNTVIAELNWEEDD